MLFDVPREDERFKSKAFARMRRQRSEISKETRFYGCLFTVLNKMVNETPDASKDLDLSPTCACAAIYDKFSMHLITKIKADSSKISIIFVVLVITCSSASDLISEDRACRCFIPAFTFRLFNGC